VGRDLLSTLLDRTRREPVPAANDLSAASRRREHRHAPRRLPEQHESLARVRLRTGSELAVLNISDGGVLVEGPARLHPGAHVDVHVVTRDGRVLVRSRVVRAFISHLEADLVRYRGALAFERRIDTTATEPSPIHFTPASEPPPTTVNPA
jgi:hypothetical protein